MSFSRLIITRYNNKEISIIISDGLHECRRPSDLIVAVTLSSEQDWPRCGNARHFGIRSECFNKNSICFQMLVTRCVRHLHFGLYGPINDSAFNGSSNGSPYPTSSSNLHSRI